MTPLNVSDIARRHGFDPAAAEVVLKSLRASGGGSAQFDHPDLGGFGQWMPGMVQVGDMFNASLKGRVDALCAELSAHVRAGPTSAGVASPAEAAAGSWWPEALGRPNAAGGQADVAYAWFAGPRRLALRRDGAVTLYDTGEHRISGIAQSQAGEDRRLLFSTAGGAVDVASLRRVAE